MKLLARSNTDSIVFNGVNTTNYNVAKTNYNEDIKLQANKVAGMQEDHFSAAKVKNFVSTVFTNDAGGPQKAGELLEALIATRWELYAIQLMDQ